MNPQSNPCDERTLIVCDRRSEAIEVCKFGNLGNWLNAGDAIVLAVEQDKLAGNATKEDACKHWMVKTQLAPTLLQRLTSQGVKVLHINLHSESQRPSMSKNHHHRVFRFDIPDETADVLNETAALGHRILAEGLPVLEILQAATDELGFYRGGCGIVKPSHFSSRPRHYSAVDMLLTELYPPSSTDFLLGGSSFAGPVLVGRVHREAVSRGIYKQQASVPVLFI